jgi:diguanylate cyclase (GGDEF)-like protein
MAERRRNLEYLRHGFQDLATALSKIDTSKGDKEIQAELVDICEREFRCSRAEYIPSEEVRFVLGENKRVRKLLHDHSYFQRGNDFYVPLSNDGFRNLGVLHLMEVTPRLSQQPQHIKDPIFDYLGLQLGMTMSLVRQRDYDKLTGLYRKDCFQAAFDAQIRIAREKGQPLSLICGDLDHFKWYNDNFGHPQGDEALRTTGRVIREAVRDSDIPVRNGGEEFAILLPNTDCRGAYVVGERIRSAIESTRVDTTNSHRVDTDTPYHLGTPSRLNGSFGIACFPLHTPDPNDLVGLADAALYQAKQNRNCVSIYSPRKR